MCELIAQKTPPVCKGLYFRCKAEKKSSLFQKKITLLYRCVIFTFCVKVLMTKTTVRKNILTCEFIAQKKSPVCKGLNPYPLVLFNKIAI